MSSCESWSSDESYKKRNSCEKYIISKKTKQKKIKKKTKYIVIRKEVVKKIKPLDENKDIITNNEELQCIICMNNRKSVVFIDCSHMILCCKCANKIIDSNKMCPLCKKEIKQCPVFVFPN